VKIEVELRRQLRNDDGRTAQASERVIHAKDGMANERTLILKPIRVAIVCPKREEFTNWLARRGTMPFCKSRKTNTTIDPLSVNVVECFGDPLYQFLKMRIRERARKIKVFLLFVFGCSLMRALSILSLRHSRHGMA
jgi:hypothetical protein